MPASSPSMAGTSCGIRHGECRDGAPDRARDVAMTCCRQAGREAEGTGSEQAPGTACCIPLRPSLGTGHPVPHPTASISTGTGWGPGSEARDQLLLRQPHPPSAFQAAEEHLAWLGRQGPAPARELLRGVADGGAQHQRAGLLAELGQAPGAGGQQLPARLHRPLHREQLHDRCQKMTPLAERCTPPWGGSAPRHAPAFAPLGFFSPQT